MSDDHKREARHLGPKFEEAFQLAFDLHQTKGKQGRKGKDTPYVSHLMAVAALVLEYGGSEEEAIAALLHDAVEDQGGPKTLRMIEEKFGQEVAKIVADCSDCEGDPKPPWRERKKKYIDHLSHVSPSSRIVSLADKIHNAGTILRDVRQHGVQTFERFNGKRNGTLWYYDALARTFLAQNSDNMAMELDRIVQELYAASHEQRPKHLEVPENETMTRMLDMIKQSAVPANLMRTAAKGALALPAPEMVEILVFLSHHQVVGEQARMTLAAWDVKQAEAIAVDPATSVEVLEYLVSPKNLRPQLFLPLLENPSVPEKSLVEIADGASRDMAKIMLTSARVRGSEKILLALKANPHLTVAEHEAIKAAMGGQAVPAADEGPLEDFEETPEMREFLEKHAAEIEAEQNHGFELFREEGIEHDELDDLLGLAQLNWKDEKATHKPADKHVNPEDEKKLSTLQKLARMRVGERVQAAMKGNKDERFILIRDGAKVVALAVLESPKLTDSEVEMIAGMKNVQEAVLRGVAAKRKFMKNYAVIRALINNPRVPLDVSLPLMPHLLVMDLKHLSMNKNVSDLLRKLALKFFREKSESRKKE